MKTFIEWLTKNDIILETSDIAKFGDLTVLDTFSMTEDDYMNFHNYRYQYRYITKWLLLSDGSAIGWQKNNKHDGWNFPRIGKTTVLKNFPSAAKILKDNAN
ncbi:MAG: hypothetical protein COA52_00355 [Hyphomicrobiales bacterium]|nr:MAG: hypothetical protein COA52_00355 [Hyphomicrobiales bacterium]